MALLPILTYDDETLREKASPVTENSEELQKLLDDMFETMYNANGVGLAAPQIGKLLRIFVADADGYADKKEKKEEDTNYGPLVFINPSIQFKSEQEATAEEGCLSIPDVRGEVTRPQAIVVSYWDREFNKQKLEVDGALARIIQHEIDHLDGVLFIDHISYFKRKLLSKKLNDLAEGRREIAYPVAGKK